MLVSRDDAPRASTLPRTLPLPRITIVGPAPPPSGGMANQCRQLVRLLQSEDVTVEFVRNNAPCRPAWIEKVPVLRAGFRIVPYVRALWRAAGRSDVVHVFANSGWAWHLFAAPAVAIATSRGVPVIVNYRGGNAGDFLAVAPRYVRRMLARVSALVTPSEFLQGVFARYGLTARIVPNIVDLTRFTDHPARNFGRAPHLIVTRNLESIYDIPTAIRAFARVRAVFPDARLSVAGSGPERAPCERLAYQLGQGAAVFFTGRIDNDQIASLYAAADLFLNPSTIDNMPISILEAYASAVPVVTTDVGGIPCIATHERTALLVPAHDPEAMATAALRVLQDRELAQRLTAAGRERARDYSWPAVRDRWYAVYRAVAMERTARAKNPA